MKYLNHRLRSKGFKSLVIFIVYSVYNLCQVQKQGQIEERQEEEEWQGQTKGWERASLLSREEGEQT